MFDNNKILANILKDISSIYKYLGGNERFRALAYERAFKVISSLPNDITFYYTDEYIIKLRGIGDSISKKIIEFLKTGKIKKYEVLKKSVPYELLGLLDIKGFGPKSLKQIHTKLNITTEKEFLTALENGSISKLKNFGPKKNEAMLKGFKLHKLIIDRMLLWDALEIAENCLKWFKNIPEVINAELAGSLRRRKETIGDIDILISCEHKNRKLIVSKFIKSSLVRQVIVKGETKVSVVLNVCNRQLDLRLVNQDEWGSALLYFTGSKEHNIHLRILARQKGFKISEYGIFSISSGKKIAGKTEEEIYNTIGYKIMPPEMRENKGEFDLSLHNKIPDLISVNDIKGDLQLHSIWSDGQSTLEEIINHLTSNFSYQYIAITDHSKSSRIANGMNEKKILNQIKEIDLINKKYGNYFLKSGLEVDILSDGKLDISDDVLCQLDWVTASIHSNFNRDNTDRIIAACENKYVCCVGHPTGRLIGIREPYKLDMTKIIDAAAKTFTALEINAQPNRMDLNDDLAWLARENKVKLVISTDSHSLNDFNYMKLGVFIARRAWCKADDVLNTKSWDEIKAFKNLKRKKHILEFSD
jgi:DNA polymerase (family 10)